MQWLWCLLFIGLVDLWCTAPSLVDNLYLWSITSSASIAVAVVSACFALERFCRSKSKVFSLISEIARSMAVAILLGRAAYLGKTDLSSTANVLLNLLAGYLSLNVRLPVAAVIFVVALTVALSLKVVLQHPPLTEVFLRGIAVLLGYGMGVLMRHCQEKEDRQASKNMHYTEECIEKLLHENRVCEKLACAMLPRSVVGRMLHSDSHLKESHSVVTILFSDLVGFTKWSSDRHPEVVASFLMDLFSHFDKAAERYGVEKIKTIGDAYWAVGGMEQGALPARSAACIAAMSLEMLTELKKVCGLKDEQMEMRIGIHSGPVIAGLVGQTKISYDVFGSTNTVAVKLESTSEPGRIQVSGASKALIEEDLEAQFYFERRGALRLPDGPETPTYWLVRTMVPLHLAETSPTPSQTPAEMTTAICAAMRLRSFTSRRSRCSIAAEVAISELICASRSVSTTCLGRFMGPDVVADLLREETYIGQQSFLAGNVDLGKQHIAESSSPWRSESSHGFGATHMRPSQPLSDVNIHAFPPHHAILGSNPLPQMVPVPSPASPLRRNANYGKSRQNTPWLPVGIGSQNADTSTDKSCSLTDDISTVLHACPGKFDSMVDASYPSTPALCKPLMGMDMGLRQVSCGAEVAGSFLQNHIVGCSDGPPSSNDSVSEGDNLSLQTPVYPSPCLIPVLSSRNTSPLTRSAAQKVASAVQDKCPRRDTWTLARQRSLPRALRRVPKAFELIQGSSNPPEHSSASLPPTYRTADSVKVNVPCYEPVPTDVVSPEGASFHILFSLGMHQPFIRFQTPALEKHFSSVAICFTECTFRTYCRAVVALQGAVFTSCIGDALHYDPIHSAIRSPSIVMDAVVLALFISMAGITWLCPKLAAEHHSRAAFGLLYVILWAMCIVTVIISDRTPPSCFTSLLLAAGGQFAIAFLLVLCLLFASQFIVICGRVVLLREQVILAGTLCCLATVVSAICVAVGNKQLKPLIWVLAWGLAVIAAIAVVGHWELTIRQRYREQVCAILLKNKAQLQRNLSRQLICHQFPVALIPRIYRYFSQPQAAPIFDQIPQAGVLFFSFQDILDAAEPEAPEVGFELLQTLCQLLDSRTLCYPTLEKIKCVGGMYMVAAGFMSTDGLQRKVEHQEWLQSFEQRGDGMLLQFGSVQDVTENPLTLLRSCTSVRDQPAPRELLAEGTETSAGVTYDTHLLELAHLANDLMIDIKAFKNSHGSQFCDRIQNWGTLDMKARAGLTCGPAVGAVLGCTKWVYDLLGDTVNLACRLMQTAQPNTIQCTGENCIKQLMECEEFNVRGPRAVYAKGKGALDVWTLTRKVQLDCGGQRSF